MASSFLTRCSEEELDALDERAKTAGLSRQQFVYASLFGEPPEPEHVGRMREVARARETLVGPSEPEERPQGTPRARPAPLPVGTDVPKPRKQTGLVKDPRDDVTPFFKGR